ncbi:MAG: pre-peptidase [Isosphaeraceae bacterium]|nr:pre-peptidase [Isosphaeraceae bacterium]
MSISGVGDFSGASRLLFSAPGIEGSIVGHEAGAADSKSGPAMKATSKTSTTAEIVVRPDAPLGPVEVRVVTPQGVSSIGMAVITADPVVDEGDDKANGKPETAPRIALPCAVSGKIGVEEDVDRFIVRANRGETLSFEVWANRLEDKIHDLQTHLDPILVLTDARGRELASNDNARFADPALEFEIPETGDYRVEIRDAGYAGNVNWSYVLLAARRPSPFAIFPSAVPRGSEVEVEPIVARPEASGRVRLRLDPSVPVGPGAFPLKLSDAITWPVPMFVTDHPIVVEQGDAPSQAGGLELETPVAFSGRLLEAGDIDRFTVAVQKGRRYDFEVVARRIGSELDPTMRLLDPAGKTLAEVDDSPSLGKDARVEWTSTFDGSLSVEISDLHARGGRSFGYALIARAAAPDFTMSVDPDKINAGPGTRTPVFVKVERRGGFDGPIAVELAGLPSGMSASKIEILPNMTQGVFVVEVAPDAKPDGKLVQVLGKASVGENSISRAADSMQEIYLPGGGRGLWKVATIAAAVMRQSDIAVEAKPGMVRLAPGGSVEIEVDVRRLGTFDKPVNLAVELKHLGSNYASPLPKGVTLDESKSKTLLGPKETKGKIVLKAANDVAPCDPVPIAVMGHVSINFVVKTSYCSAPIMLQVEKPGGGVAAR